MLKQSLAEAISNAYNALKQSPDPLQWHKTYWQWHWSILPRPQAPTVWSHRQEATTKKTQKHKVLPHWLQACLSETSDLTSTSPLVSAPLAATARCWQPARGLSNAVNIRSWAIHKTRPDRGCDGVSQGAFVQPCHVYSCSKSNTSLFAMVLSFLVISQSDSWLKTVLGLDIWVYESIKKIPHIISLSSLLGKAFLKLMWFCEERDDQVLGLSTNIYWLYPIQPIFTSRGHI